MSLTKEDKAVLRKQYPEEYYTIREHNNKLEVVPKKVVVRLFAHQVAKLNLHKIDGDTFSETLMYKLENKELTPADFEQRQITVEKRVSDKLNELAKNCKTRKIIYLQHLLGVGK